MSADPLEIHAGSSGELNVYAYVSGRALKAVDPRGLCDPAVTSCEATGSTAEGGVQYGGGSDTTVVRATAGGGAASPPPRAVPSAPPTGTGGAAAREKGGYGGAVPNPETDPYIDRGGPVFSHQEMTDFALSLPHHQGLAMSTPERAPDYLGHQGRRAAALETGRMAFEIGATTGSLAAGPGFLGEAAVTLPSSLIRFSQSSVSGVGPVAESMAARGWVGPPIDVVRLESGLVTIDNSRLLAAHLTDTPVRAAIHGTGEALPGAMAGRFVSKSGVEATTWGEALQIRIANQNAAYRSLFPEGSWATGVSH